MKILFLGDIMGQPGREAVKKLLPPLKEKIKPEFVFANGENLSHGRGMTEKTVQEMQEAGIDFFTSGNHVWQQKEVLPKLDDPKFPVLRPANYPPGVPGRGYAVLQTGLMKKVLVINLLGRVFFRTNLDCPFRTAEKILEETKHEALSAIIVDFHAEATSEKTALAHFLAGKVSAVLGTHTHVPTADARILKDHTAYLTDVGMVGLKDSVIGVDKEPVLKMFLTQLPAVYEITQIGPCVFQTVMVEIDDETGKAVKINQILQETE